MAEVSVIIPVYNTEKYIKRCLQSVIEAEGFDKCEVILIDDGSTDNSARIAEETAGQYSNITLYRFANAGPSAARNRGIKLSAGRFLYFLDSDDCLQKDYLEKLYSAMKETECDMVFAGFSKMSEDGMQTRPVYRKILDQTGVMTGREYLDRRMDLGDWENRVWAMMFRKGFLQENKLSFDEEVLLYEDILLINRALLYAGRVCSISAYGYQYRHREKSLVQGGVKTRDIVECMKVLDRFQVLWSGLNIEQQNALGRVLFAHISMTLYYIGILRPDQKREYYKRIRQKELSEILRKTAVSKKERMKYIIFRYWTGLYYLLVRKRS